jgi:hypothetical protein
MCTSSRTVQLADEYYDRTHRTIAALAGARRALDDPSGKVRKKARKTLAGLMGRLDERNSPLLRRRQAG